MLTVFRTYPVAVRLTAYLSYYFHCHYTIHI